MRNKMTFIAAAAAILLAGALAAWTAARQVVEPPAGETLSAGELSVPTVFGQTAEEVLFYPWSLYDTQTLYSIPEESLTEIFGNEVLRYVASQSGEPEKNPSKGTLYYYVNVSGQDPAGNETVSGVIVEPSESDTGSAISEESAVLVVLQPVSELSLFDNFSLIQPVDFQMSELLSALEWNLPPGSGEFQSLHLYLKDLRANAYLGPDGRDGAATPVKLSFAFSASNKLSASFLIRPVQVHTPSAEAQSAAMEVVDRELRGLFFSPNTDATALGTLLQNFLSFNQPMPTSQYNTDLRLLILENLFGQARRYYSQRKGWVEFVEWPESLWDQDLPLDDFLAGIESLGSLTVQLINTQSQIVVLFSLEGGQVLGAYYDIQLGCWSGVGYME